MENFSLTKQHAIFFVAEIAGAAKPFRRNDNPEKLDFCTAKSHPNKKKTCQILQTGLYQE
ncbi:MULTISPECIES: hypothetical protein [unclassified Treponema]|uniref:hypothetical protein n=1 Tax=unclassified Treponema TaxID=2638727 RepID=UPI0025F8CFF9|nr:MULTISPECIES: hypothetical protein [unclassified Treponema]